MKALVGSGLAAFALMLTGCGGEEGAGNGSAANNAPLTQIKAPNGDWTQNVTQTPEGGFLMGNPQAPVKVVEFASMTCGVCAAFAEEGAPRLVDTYVKSGQVSFEIRNFVRDIADIAAALIARCNGPSAFFPLSDQLFAAQQDWYGRIGSLPSEQQQQLRTLPGHQAAPAIAQAGGLDEFARVRGIPTAKVQACVADQGEIQRLITMNAQAVKEYDIQGTPSFLVNGRLIEGSNWATLEPEIRKALP